MSDEENIEETINGNSSLPTENKSVNGESSIVNEQLTTYNLPLTARNMEYITSPWPAS